MSETRSFNIAAYLEQRAKEIPYSRGVVFPEKRDAEGRVAWTHLSFQDLNSLANEYARGLAELGVKQGDRVSLLVKPCLEFIPLVFAIFKLGALPVLIDPGMGRKSFLSCLSRMKPRVLIAVPIVQALKGLFPKAFKTIEVSITVGKSTGWWGGSTLDGLRIKGSEPFATVETKAEDEAAILFTSGSTGPAKGVTYTHGIFDAQTRFIGNMYDIKPGEIDLACFPLFGLFSMALGMTVVIPELDPTKPAQADPAKLVEAIQTQGCTFSFGSPSIWKNVSRYCEKEGVQLPSLKRILMAGAPVPTWLHESFAKILTEGAQIHTPYGATESLPVASIGSQEVLGQTGEAARQGKGTCVGRAAPDMLIRIIRIDDKPITRFEDAEVLPAGEIGEICVRGPVVTPEYKEEPKHTQAAKMLEKLGGEEYIVHRMGDVGYLDEEGRLWFCGRKKHRVETEQGTYFPVPCEAIYDEHPEVAKTALVGVSGEPIIIAQLEPGARKAKAEITEELLSMGSKFEHTKKIQRILFHPSFPVDVRHNAKIHREELAVWAKEQKGAQA